MNNETIAAIAKECLAEEGTDFIDMGKYGLLDEIYDRAFKRGIVKKKINHPLDRQAYIMAQLRKSKQFKRVGYIDYPGFRRAYARCAVLIPVEDPDLAAKW
jgi:hypothetical protein